MPNADLTPAPTTPTPVDVAAARAAAARPTPGRGTGNLYVGPGLGAALLGFLAVLADVDEVDAAA